VDIFTPGNVVYLETILSMRASGTVAAAGPVKYLVLDAVSLQRLAEDRRLRYVSPRFSLMRAGAPKSWQLG